MRKPIFLICLIATLVTACNKHQNPQPIQQQKVTQVAKVDSLIGTYIGLRWHYVQGPSERDTSVNSDTVRVIKVTDTSFLINVFPPDTFMYDPDNVYSFQRYDYACGFTFNPSKDSLAMSEHYKLGSGLTTINTFFSGKK